MKIDKPEESKEMQKESSAVSYYEAVGRRKESSARVRLYVVKETSVSVGGQVMEKGAMVVNGRPVEQYFPGEVYKKMYQEPFRTTNTVSRFAISVKTSGGGLAGQLGAVIHGISRALEKVDKEKFRPILKKRGFMKRDPRAKQENNRPSVNGRRIFSESGKPTRGTRGNSA